MTLNKRQLTIRAYNDLSFASEQQLILSDLIDITKLTETGLRISYTQFKKYSGNILVQSIFDEQFYSDHTPFFDILCYLDAFYHYEFYKTYSETHELEFSQEFNIFSDYIRENYGKVLQCTENTIPISGTHKKDIKPKKFANKFKCLFGFLLQTTQLEHSKSSSLIICHSNRHLETCQELIANFSMEDAVRVMYGFGVSHPKSRLDASSICAVLLLACKLPFLFLFFILQLNCSMKHIRRDVLLLSVYKYNEQSFGTKKLYVKCLELALLTLAIKRIRKNKYFKDIYFIGYLELFNKYLSMGLRESHKTTLIRYNDAAFSLERATLVFQFDEVLTKCQQAKHILGLFIESVRISPLAELVSERALKHKQELSSGDGDTEIVLIVDESIPKNNTEKEMRLRFLGDLAHLNKRLAGKVCFTLRPHPTTQCQQTPFNVSTASLEEDLLKSRIIIGRNSTFLLRASRLGHDVVVYDPSMGKFYIQNKDLFDENIVWVSNIDVLFDVISKYV